MNTRRTEEYKIDKECRLPFYYQLKEIIREKIRQAELQPGDRIPTEHELCERFAISRTPVRQALAELVNEGLLFRHRGRGTFVDKGSRSDVSIVKIIIPEERWRPPLERAKEIWNKENSDCEIGLNISIVGYPKLRSKIISAVARGKAPDLALIDSVWVAEFAELDYLQPLEELDNKWVEQNFKRDFFPSCIDSSYDSHHYGIPPEVDIAVLWFRRDWFETEGLKPPQNWDELIKAVQYFKSEEVRSTYDIGDYPLAFPGGLQAGETTSYILLPLLWAAGEPVFVNGEVVLGKGARQVLDLLVRFVHKYRVADPDVVSYEWNRSPILFGESKVALSFGGSYEKSVICKAGSWSEKQFKERADIIPFPAGPRGRSMTMASGMVFSIFRQSNASCQALELLKAAVSPPVMKDFCCATGQNASRISVAQALDPEKHWFLHRTSDLLYNARVRPRIPEYAAVSEQLRMMVENALSKRITTKEAVNKAEEAIGVIMAERKRQVD